MWGGCVGLMEVRGKAISVVSGDGRNTRAVGFIALALPFSLPYAAGLWIPARKFCLLVLLAWVVGAKLPATGKYQRQSLRDNPPDLAAQLYRAAVPHSCTAKYSRVGPGCQTDINQVQGRLLVVPRGQKALRPQSGAPPSPFRMRRQRGPRPSPSGSC